MRGDPAVVLAKLHEEGLFVEVKHYRLNEGQAEVARAAREDRVAKLKFDDQSRFRLSAKGGHTHVSIGRHINESGPPIIRPIAAGDAHCSPFDAFNRKTGLRIALGRAIAYSPELQGILQLT